MEYLNEGKGREKEGNPGSAGFREKSVSFVIALLCFSEFRRRGSERECTVKNTIHSGTGLMKSSAIH